MKTLKKKTERKSSRNHEPMVNNAPRLFEIFDVGSVSHQGDIIVVRIASMPESAKPRASRQLADGNTQGSRHILERGEVFDCKASEVQSLIKSATKCDVGLQYIGPVFLAPNDPTDSDLTHPEHGNQGFPAGSVCAVVYQRNLDAEQREQRTRD